MPKKVKSKKLNLKKIDEIISAEPPKSYQSLLYGVLTVIVLFILIFLGLKVISQRNAGTITEESASTKQNIYVVKKGDSLWTIAQDKYKDGYKWTEIAEANELSNASKIEPGTRLIIPEINTALAISETPTPTESPTLQPTRAPTKIVTKAPTAAPTIKPTITPTPTNVPKISTSAQQNITTSGTGTKIGGSSYTVVAGDNLWNIAVRAYGDGYKWTEIASANNLANPDLIHSGNKFVLPR